MRNKVDTPPANEADSQCPRLRPDTPIIRRDDRLAHVGDNPFPASISEREAQWLRTLPEFNSWTKALAVFPGHAERAERLIKEVRNRGALEDTGECWWLSPQERLNVQPSLSALSSWHNHPPSAIARRMASTITVISAQSWAAVMNDALVAGGLQTTEEPHHSDVVIVCASLPADAPEAVLSLLPQGVLDRPHLPVAAYRGRASIGPLVEPGLTPCLRCAYLHHRDADHSWPSIVSQWSEHRANIASGTDPLLALHSAAHAAAMVQGWIDSSRQAPPRRVVIESPSFRAQERAVAFHPECGCAWGTAPFMADQSTGRV